MGRHPLHHPGHAALLASTRPAATPGPRCRVRDMLRPGVFHQAASGPRRTGRARVSGHPRASSDRAGASLRQIVLLFLGIALGGLFVAAIVCAFFLIQGGVARLHLLWLDLQLRILHESRAPRKKKQSIAIKPLNFQCIRWDWECWRGPVACWPFSARPGGSASDRRSPGGGFTSLGNLVFAFRSGGRTAIRTLFHTHLAAMVLAGRAGVRLRGRGSVGRRPADPPAARNQRRILLISLIVPTLIWQGFLVPVRNCTSYFERINSWVRSESHNAIYAYLARVPAQRENLGVGL